MTINSPQSHTSSNKDKVANIDLFVDIINLHCKPFLNGRMAFNA